MREPIASGREADVYPLDEHRVLRRYRAGGDATPEADVMAYLGERGYPVPRVYAAGGPDLVLERLSGPTMLGAWADGQLAVADGAAILADLHRRLHALPARVGRRPGDRVLHLDLHPENILMTPSGPVVIDWRNTEEGPPELDLAMTAVIIAEVAVEPGSDVAEVARPLLSAFLRAAGTSLSKLDAAVARRAANTTLSPTEHARLPAAAALIRASAP